MAESKVINRERWIAESGDKKSEQYQRSEPVASCRPFTVTEAGSNFKALANMVEMLYYFTLLPMWEFKKL